MLISYLGQIFKCSPFLSGFHNIIFHVFALSVMHATCATHLIRGYLVIVTMTGKEYKL
jgi:hypothetical protein